METKFTYATYLRVGVLLIFTILLISCSQNETDALKNDLSALRSKNSRYEKKIDSLQKEIALLTATDQYYYQQAVALGDSQRFIESRDAFQSLVTKFPLSPYTSNAKQQISTLNSLIAREEKRILDEQRRLEKFQRDSIANEEKRMRAEQKRRQDEAKYVVRSPQEAINEWKQFRTNEAEYKGTVTTWRLRVANIFSENPHGYLGEGGYSDYQVTVLGNEEGYWTYALDVYLGKMPKVKVKDWIVVTGRFVGISDDNVVALRAIRVKNEGYQE